MSTWQTMYPAQPGSPQTTTDGAIDSDDLAVVVSSADGFIAATNLAVLWDDLGNFEVVKYTDITGTTLTIERAFEGTARAWPSGSNIANLLTAYAVNSLQNNVNEIVADVKTVTEITSTPEDLAVNRRYTANSASLIVFTLPSTAAIGDVIEVIGVGDGGWKVLQNAGQHIRFGACRTTIGTNGYIASVYASSAVMMKCIIADTAFEIVYGNSAIEMI